ncbi:MAG: murein biosynthesis integral membrane protein MurJ [Actinomycetia bacterium]|nr:murein biosynthesis integral membrane protein MurJ [Actinomycetes bacterium]
MIKKLSGTVAVSLGILTSRLVGLVREVVVRVNYGSTPVGDGYAAALRIPNLLQNLLGEGVLSASFIPVYSEMVDNDPRRAGRLASTMFVFLTVVSLPLVLILVVFAGPITELFLFGNQNTETIETATVLTRIMAPGVGVLVLSAWSLGVLNSHRRFFLPYAAPVVWSLAQIAVVFGPEYDTLRTLAIRVAWAATIGAVLQFTIQLPAIRSSNPHIGLRIDFGDSAFGDVLRRMGSVIVGRGSAQLSAFVDLMLAGFLAFGALTALGTAQVFYLLPISLFAMSVAAAELPELSRMGSDLDSVADRLAAGLQTIAFFMVFTTLAFVLAGRRILGAVFSLVPRNGFDQDGLILVALVLGSYSLGLLAIGSSRLVQNTFYALGDASTPAQVAIVRYGISALVGFVLMLQFDRLFIYDGVVTGLNQLLSPLEALPSELRSREDLPLRLGAVGLALGAAAGGWFEFFALRDRLLPVLGTSSLTMGRWRPLVLPSLASTLWMLVSLPLTSGWHDITSTIVVVGVGGCLYVAISAHNRVAAARIVVDRLKRSPGTSVDMSR